METDAFQIHPQLLRDCLQLGGLGACRLLLHRNASLPWFILVPRCETEGLLDLKPAIRNQIMDASATVAEFIKGYFNCPKINFASIGNVVPQLHIHVVGRKPTDPIWPKPVWGHLKIQRAYSEKEIEDLKFAFSKIPGFEGGMK